MDIDILDELNTYLVNFNAFETLGIVNTEIRHSNVLGWLLDPNENHGLQDAFLKRFMQRIFYNFKEMPHSNLSLFDLTDINFSTFIVRREWRHIDLIIYSEVDEIVIVIENKVWSKESKHQLKTYMDIVTREFSQYHQIFLFLTPEGEEASDTENWISINYNLIRDVLNKVLNLKEDVISESVKYFVRQYEEVVRRYIVGDKELEKICRKIYFKHQKALDLIFEFKPDIYSDIATHLEDKLQRSDFDLELDTSGKTYIRFTSDVLDKIVPKVGQGWTSSKRMLLFEIQNKNFRLVLKLIIGPGDQDMRNTIYEMAKRHTHVFNSVPKNLTSQYTQIYQIELLPRHFEDSFESMEEITDTIDRVFDRFYEKELIEIENVLKLESESFIK